ncbi:GIY-YIG nuclease family protein [Camelliibacillus cellulosilyticus]|uniref:GIY-YIG nuclease family protein n=1 Tax=Camelliibacillus cellulosilyticus TaxID=2174486 RepID=A0ABV9GQ04_9BACL
MNKPYFVYILECADGTYYTGCTNDIDRRITAHQNGTASKYTRTRRPVRLVYQEWCGLKGSALSREYAIKNLTRKEKQLLIKEGNGHAGTEQL